MGATKRTASYYLDELLLARVEKMARQEGRSASNVVERLLLDHPALPQLVGREYRDFLRRTRLAAEAEAPEGQARLRTCPECGSSDAFVHFNDGKWRCDMCLATGKTEPVAA